MGWMLPFPCLVLLYLVCATTIEVDFGFPVTMEMTSTCFEEFAEKMVYALMPRYSWERGVGASKRKTQVSGD